MNFNKCKICEKYDFEKEQCSFCKFEYAEDLYWNDDSQWDILKMDDDIEWSHLQIMYRLKAKNIDCLYTDIWFDNKLAYILGAKASGKDVAQALGVHEEVVYDGGENPILIINLFQEKYLRGELDV